MLGACQMVRVVPVIVIFVSDEKGGVFFKLPRVETRELPIQEIKQSSNQIHVTEDEFCELKIELLVRGSKH